MVTLSPCCLRVCRVVSRANLSWGQADLAGSDGGSLQNSRTQIRDQLQAAEVLRSEGVRARTFRYDLLDSFELCGCSCVIALINVASLITFMA